MTTLVTIRDRVRKQDLRNTDSDAYRWPDTQLDRHIERALRDLSLATPRERTLDVATTPGSRNIPLSSFEGLIAIEAVEYPALRYPPRNVRFATWDGSLTILEDTPPDGSDARVHFTAEHTLDSETSTVPIMLEDVLATGASAYAALEIAGFTIDRITNTGSASEDYAAWGRAWLVAFRELLRQHGRRRDLRTGRLYRPA